MGWCFMETEEKYGMRKRVKGRRRAEEKEEGHMCIVSPEQSPGKEKKISHFAAHVLT